MALILQKLPAFLRENKHGKFIFYYGLICLLALPGEAAAQSARAYRRAGDAAVRQKDYGSAIQHYAAALEQKPEKVEVIWRYAECARMLNAFPVAEKMYRRLGTLANPARISPLLPFRLGEVLKSQGKYAEALEAFGQYLKTTGPNAADPYSDRARVEIEVCRWAMSQAPEKPGMEIKNAGKSINSPYSEFGPFISGDTLYFSSYRFDKRGDKSQPRQKLTKVMLAPGFNRAREAARGFPSTDTAHVAHTAFTPDGHFLFVNLCKNLNASDIRCELWLSVKDIRGRWGNPLRLPEPVNQSGFTTTQPSVAYDSLQEQLLLWFASDRPGGKGKLDVWFLPLDTIWFCPCNVPLSSSKPLRLPRFETPRNLETVNTPENEATPFYFAPSRTLYFSSEGWPGFGGYDIFSAQEDISGFTAPVNAGRGLNTSYNDLYYVLRPDGKSGFLSSNRPGSQYLDEVNKACCNDIFSVRFPGPPAPEPPLVQATPVPRTPVARPMIPVERLQEPEPPKQLADFVGLPLYFDNDEPDKRTRRTTTKKRYDETVEAYLNRQVDYRARFSEGLEEVKRDDAEDSVDHFFDNEVRRGYERLEQLCELLRARLQSGEPVEVIIKGFTSPRAESDYNLALGRRRISSVRNYFEAYDNGVLAPFIQSGRLKISEASFGETTVRTGISDNLNDERNSIYHPDAARERRVEIIEIRENQ